MSEYMERLYRVYPWPDNPYTEEGGKRFLESVEVFKKITYHEWVRDLVSSRKRIRIVDVCGGGGIGGVALAKVIGEKYGVETELTIVDLRRDALGIAERFSEETLGYRAETIIADITKRLKLGKRYDLALLWGHSTPHFSPWDLIRLYANISEMLTDNGLYMYEEGDRIYGVFIRSGYKEIKAETTGKDNIVLTIHQGKDPISGYIHRLAYNLVTGEKESMKIYFWDISGSAALAWIFFKDIDYTPIKSRYAGVVLARGPRREIDPQGFLEEIPKILKGELSIP